MRRARAVATGLGLGQAAAQGTCPHDEPIRCGNDCADLRSNPEHCGRCVNACAAGHLCYAGQCMASCPSGFTACNGTCARNCPSDCVPKSCADAVIECGVMPDGCGDTLHCGLCEDVILCGSSADCTDLDDDCNIGVCNEATGECEAMPANEGEPCDNGDPCIKNSVCSVDGACTGGTAKDCTDFTDDCNVGVCHPSTGTCEASPTNEGGACGTDGTCQNGACEGALQSCADTCSGCCSGESCHPGIENNLCGSGGISCANCLGGTCRNQVCDFSAPVPQECNTTNCALGCCDGDTCVTNLSAQQCGRNGEACVSCGPCEWCPPAVGQCGPLLGPC